VVIRLLTLILLLAACGTRVPASAPSNVAAANGEVTLYRDRALVLQRLELDIAPASYATVRVKVAAGIDADDIHVVERDRFTVRELREVDGDLEVALPGPAEAPPAAQHPTEIALVIGAPRAGRFVVHLAYITDRITWDAAYTMTATATHDRAVLRGALAIRNLTGVALRGVRVRLIDAALARSTMQAAELLASSYVGAAPVTTAGAVPRDLGVVDLAGSETRIELLAASAARPMHSVLVYDPFGTALDQPSADPVHDRNLGVVPAASSRVTESFELARDVAGSAGLPGGPVRLLERRADGSLGLLGEARIFDASARVAEVDTVAVGTAEGVTGKRERREYTLDLLAERLVEELVITIENTRPRPVEVVVREHLYRGTNWTLAYHSAPAAKEGPQQVSMRMTVPARGQAKLLYVVVYTW
jgi:hypothetical protein